MQPNRVRTLRTLAFICLFTGFAGVIYQLINEKHLDHRSVLVGLPLGLAFGLLELFLFPKTERRFQHWSFTKITLFKILLYTAAIYVVSVIMMFIAGLFEHRKISELFVSLASLDQLILVVYTLAIYSLLVFFLHLNRLLGEGILWKFISGKYHKPHEEERIFMFLDMNSSTTIAEQLGHVRFYALLNELFHEISQPVLQTKAEIYQYVGDEVVLTWEVKQGLENANCLKTFFLFQENLHRNSSHYLKKFGVQPTFKAGLHFGKVISAQIGDLKQEIVYNGDVLNTTARIRDACRQYQCECLVSGILMNQLKSMNGSLWERIGATTLRGKETEVELFSVSDIRSL